MCVCVFYGDIDTLLIVQYVRAPLSMQGSGFGFGRRVSEVRTGSAPRWIYGQVDGHTMINCRGQLNPDCFKRKRELVKNPCPGAPSRGAAGLQAEARSV